MTSVDHDLRSQYDDYVTGLRVWLPVFRISVIARVFLFTKLSTLTLGPTQPPVEWVPELFSWGETYLDVRLVTHFRLMPKLIKNGAVLYSILCFHDVQGYSK